MPVIIKKAIQFVLILVAGTLLLAGNKISPISADEGELEFVYGTNHFNGTTFSSSMIPPKIDTFYLISDVTNIVSPKFTKIYYWPLTNEYKADWSSTNINVEGTLEILQRGSIIQHVDQTSYVIQYDVRDEQNTTKLYLGDDAVEARKHFEQLLKDYRDDLFTYYEKYNQYREELDAALKDLKAGKITVADLPEEPEKGQDVTLFSTDLVKGFPINLATGEYDVRLRLPDGSIQAGSEKHLIVFDSIGEGIGYKVITRERWIKPEISNTQDEIVYAIADKVIYLEPFIQKEYNELFYSRMNNPQDRMARYDKTIWVPISSIKNADLIISGDRIISKIKLESYYVKQLPGNKLGYKIQKFNSSENNQPSFSGYKYKVTGDIVTVWLEDSSGNLLQKSKRDIRLLHTQGTWLLYVLSSLPLLLGLILFVMRDIKSKKRAKQP